MREHPGGLKVHSIQSGRVVNHAGQFRPGGVFVLESPGLTDGCLNGEFHCAEFREHREMDAIFGTGVQMVCPPWSSGKIPTDSVLRACRHSMPSIAACEFLSSTWNLR